MRNSAFIFSFSTYPSTTGSYEFEFGSIGSQMFK